MLFYSFENIFERYEENKYPFFEKQNSIVKVPRSNKEYSVGKITKYPLVLHNSILCVECDFEEQRSCETAIDTLLNRKDYKPKCSLKKLVDASLYNVNVLNLFNSYSIIKDPLL